MGRRRLRKIIETVSYTTALMEIGVRDFTNQMGPGAPPHPPAPPNSISYAGHSGTRVARNPPDFSAEANFGVQWLLKMWNNSSQSLAYQVDNTQDWNYYGEGDPSSATGNAVGTYNTPYCLFTEYDIWTLPQAADNYQQDGDSKPCNPLTTFYICNRPVYTAELPQGAISPNLAGRLAADFAVCYQLNRKQNAALANQCRCMRARTPAMPIPPPRSDRAPAPPVCSPSLPLTATRKRFGKTTWNWGATELYLALNSAQGSLPSGLPTTNPKVYLQAGRTVRRQLRHEYL